MGRLILAAALASLLATSPLAASPLATSHPVASATAERQRCLDLVQLVIEDLSENQSLLARLRDRLAEAAALCRAGRTQDAETLLRELQGQWMPMGPGN
jgi:pentatricopeptide repeat protein